MSLGVNLRGQANTSAAFAPPGARPRLGPHPPHLVPEPDDASLLWLLLPVLVILAFALDRTRMLYGSSGDLDIHGFGSAKLLELLAACTIYFTSGPALIILNKHIMQGMGFGFPITVSNLGNVCVMLTTQALVLSGRWPLMRKSIPRREYLQTVVPMAIFSSLSLVFGNWVYLYLSVPLIQILKSFTIVMVMVLGFVMGIERFSWPLVFAVVVIVLGICVSMGRDGERFNEAWPQFCFGVFLMFVANASEASKSVFMQISISKLAFLDSLYWCSPAMLLLGIFLAVIFELQGMLAFSMSWPLALGLLGSSALGAVVTFSNFWLTKLVGSLTMKVLVNARNIALVLFSVVAFSEPCTRSQYLGYSVVLVGVMLYDYARRALAKSQESKAENEGAPLLAEQTTCQVSYAKARDVQ